MINAQSIVFAGHFAIGTVPSETERVTLANAAAHEGDLAVLVNDMGVFRRMVLYDSYGASALLNEVRRVPRCGSVFRCAADGSANVSDGVDWNVYDCSRARIAECDNAAAKRESLRNIVADLTNDRLRRHGLDPSRVRVFFERQLRNAASARLRNRTVGGPASWRPALSAAGLLDDVLMRLSNIPTCGAILLALYERLAREGYRQVVQLYDEEDRPAIENGLRLYRVLAAAKGWVPLEIDSLYFTAEQHSSPAEAVRA